MGSLYKTIKMSEQKPVDKRRKQIEEQIFYNFVKIVQEYPQYTVSQHMWHVLRKKEKPIEAYHWTNDTLLKHFEDYKDELDRELSVVTEEEN